MPINLAGVESILSAPVIVLVAKYDVLNPEPNASPLPIALALISQTMIPLESPVADANTLTLR